MNPRYAYLCVTLTLFAAGCSRQSGEEIKKSVAVTVQTASGPVAGVAVKVVDEQAAAKALIALTARTDLKGGIPESQYGQFFESLPVAGDTETLSTDATGKTVIKRLRGQHLVVAQAGQNLWLASASETRNHSLSLGPDNMGGKHALVVLDGRAAIGDALVAAARQAFTKSEFEQARALAAASGSAIAVKEITRGEMMALLRQAEQALQEKKYDIAEKAALRANALIPDEPETKAMLDQVLTEYGGEIRTMAGHKSAINSVAYSADGKFVLSGSDDKTLKLWNTADGKEVRTFTGHRSAVTGVAFTPTGQMAISGSTDGTMRSWDVATGQQLHSTEALGWKITAVAVTPDGRLAASGADDNRITLWALPKLERTLALTGHGWRITSVVASADGKSLLSGSEDDSMKLWDLATGREIRSFGNNLAAVTCVALSPDGRLGLSGSKDKVVKLWNLETRRVTQEFTGRTGTVRSVIFSRDGRFAVSSSDDGTIRLWDISAGKAFREFTGHMGPVTSVALSPDGHSIVSGGADGTVKMWQLPRIAWPPQEAAKK